MATDSNTAAASAGTTVKLDWQASADYQFIFQLLYDVNGNFATIQCEMRGRKVDFPGNPYSLPLSLQTQDASKQEVRIAMRMGPGSPPYAGAVWCEINVPGFVFQGNAFEFSGNTSGPPPVTVW